MITNKIYSAGMQLIFVQWLLKVHDRNFYLANKEVLENYGQQS